MIHVPKCSASRRLSSVFPTPVGPISTINVFMRLQQNNSGEKQLHPLKRMYPQGKSRCHWSRCYSPEPENVYTTLYPTVARRVVESQVKLELPISQDGLQTLTLKPLDPGIVFEKIVVDFGGYRKTFLFMNESPCQRDK